VITSGRVEKKGENSFYRDNREKKKKGKRYLIAGGGGEIFD